MSERVLEVLKEKFGAAILETHAQFGDETAKEFETALAHAKQDLDQAFSLKQQLDDSTPDTERTRATPGTPFI